MNQILAKYKTVESSIFEYVIFFYDNNYYVRSINISNSSYDRMFLILYYNAELKYSRRKLLLPTNLFTNIGNFYCNYVSIKDEDGYIISIIKKHSRLLKIIKIV